MKQKDVKVTIEEAKEWYRSGNKTLYNLALRSFSKRELEYEEYPTDYLQCLAKISDITTVGFSCGKITKYTLNNIPGGTTYVPTVSVPEIDALMRLLIFRDAWWKIDGNYCPDFSSSDKKYAIFLSGDKVVCDEVTHQNRILSFSSQKLRDDFYKAFKPLIIKAKNVC